MKIAIVLAALVLLVLLGTSVGQPGYVDPFTGQWVGIGGPASNPMNQYSWDYGPSYYDSTLYPGQSMIYNGQEYYPGGNPFGTAYNFNPGMGPYTIDQGGFYDSGYTRPY